MDCQEPSCIEEPRQLGYQSCAATDWILGDGVADLIAGGTDCSQGSETVICMIAAEGSICQSSSPCDE